MKIDHKDEKLGVLLLRTNIQIWIHPINMQTECNYFYFQCFRVNNFLKNKYLQWQENLYNSNCLGKIAQNFAEMIYILQSAKDGDIFSWWCHQMITFSALLALCAGNSPVTGEFPHKGQWRGALMFSLICAWMNDWVNNREAGDLRSHGAHSNVTVML